jgi:integrase
MKLNESINLYLASLRARRLSQAHLASVAARLKRLAAAYGERPLPTITPDDIAAHFAGLEESGLALGTLAGYKSTGRAFWNWCSQSGLIESNPADALLSKDHAYDYRPVHSRAAPEADFQTAVNRLMDFASHRDYEARDVRDAALVSLAVDSAKRRTELRNLRRRDVETALGRPTTAAGRQIYHAASRGKTGQVDVVFFEETAVLLRRWLAMMPAESNWLWVNLRTGERLRPDVLAIAFIRLCEFAGVPVFRFHAVRKRTVTDIIRSAGDRKVGQLLAGHKDERTTQMHYNDVDQQRVDEMAARLADVRRGRAGGAGDLAMSFFGKAAGEGTEE